MNDFTLRDLYRSLDERKRPEDAAAMILSVGSPSPAVASTLRKATGQRGRYGWSGMSLDFQRSAASLKTQLHLASTLFGEVAPEQDDLEEVAQYLRVIGTIIRKQTGKNDFKADRLNSQQRAAAGGTIARLSRRQYNKRFRLAVRLEDKLYRRQRETMKRSLTLASKSRLASQLTWEQFSADLPTACFVAYYVARCNLRSLFTVNSQVKPYDNICDTMMKELRISRTTNWLAIAHAMPDEEIVRRLDDRQKGILMGRYYDMIVKAGQFLKEVFENCQIARRSMIVQRGNDSSTWNLMAGAWNKLRDGWFSLCSCLGAEEIIDKMCFGKVMRLMAADVAMWHKSLKGEDSKHEDTDVWADLPLPWEVLFGQATCSRDLVEATCQKHSIDPYAKGWIARRGKKVVEKFTPTPELVHGVVVSCPTMARAMRKAGIFSGKLKALRLDQSEVSVDELIAETESSRAEHWFAETGKYATVAAE